MQQMLNNLTSLTGISGFNLAIVFVFSIVSLLAVFLLCSWCQQYRHDPDESKPLIPETDEDIADRDTTERVFQRQIRIHYVTLGDNLDSNSGLLSLLFSKGVINMREKHMIQAQKIEHVRNEKLLDQMLKKTESDFSRFIDALKESNQDHIARILLKDGASLPVHINIETRLPVDVKQVELDLVLEFNKASALLLQGRIPIDDLEELMKTLLHEVQQKKALLTRAVPDKSIVLYFFCACPDVLDNIRRDFQNGSLSRCIEQIIIRHIISTSLPSGGPPAHGFINPPSINAPDRSCSALSRGKTNRPIATARFRVDEEDYKRCRENFSRGTRFAHSITLVVYIQRSFRHWRSFKRQNNAENTRSNVP